MSLRKQLSEEAAFFIQSVNVQKKVQRRMELEEQWDVKTLIWLEDKRLLTEEENVFVLSLTV